MTNRNLRAARAAVLLGAVLFMTACSSLRVGSDYDNSAVFAGYHTFAWLPRRHTGTTDSTTNPLVVSRARDAIQSELTRKGFVLVSDAGAADFAVNFTIGSAERVDIDSYPIEYRGPWGWGYHYFGDGIDVKRYREGTLAIDIFDARAHRPVWHGWANKELTRYDMEHSAGPIRAAVAEVLEQFPPH
ncbi:MAG TPA: DUF4136 domain-containing protein [Steroidobacteraceae bacterium]|nr:DUF4136 domain-containing protein [Steroidobacteraceae bacterium]